MRSLPDCSVDSVVTDPPYGISFMSQQWDTMGPEQYERWTEQWAREAIRILKPGGHLIAFCATRTVHRLTAGLEDAGFNIRDQGVWMYRSGMPKTGYIDPKIDKHLGAERDVIGYRRMPDTTKVKIGFVGMTADGRKTPMRDVAITLPASDDAKKWQGWSYQLKPAIEPWVLARKPLDGTIVENLLRYGTGCMNIDGCRSPGDEESPEGRWPANFLHDEDDEDLVMFRIAMGQIADFPKASWAERPAIDDESFHVTVKPLALMRHLVRLVTPKGGTVIDPFAGSGTTLEAAVIEGFNAIGCEKDPRYIPLIHARLGKPIQPTLGL